MCFAIVFRAFLVPVSSLCKWPEISRKGHFPIRARSGCPSGGGGNWQECLMINSNSRIENFVGHLFDKIKSMEVDTVRKRGPFWHDPFAWCRSSNSRGHLTVLSLSPSVGLRRSTTVRQRDFNNNQYTA